MLSDTRRDSLKRLLWVYLAILWSFTAGEWAFALYCEKVLRLGFPYNTPMLYFGDRFSDWYNFLPRTAHLGEAGMLTRPELGFLFPYPLPSILPYVIIQHLSSHPVRTFLITTLVCMLGGAALFSWYIQRRFKPAFVVQLFIWSTVLIGYPGVFLFDRGNIEVFLWVLVAAGIFSFVQHRPYIAATCFAIAASMKIYPAIFLLLFIPRRQYRAIAYGVVIVAAITLGMFAIVGPTIPGALRDMGPSATTLRDTQIMVMARGGLRFDHSVFALWKLITAIYCSRVLGYSAETVGYLNFIFAGRVYSILAPLAFFTIYLLRIRKLPMLNQVSSLILFSLLLPYVSYDYTLVHLYTMLALLLIALLEDDTTDRQVRCLSTIVILYAIVFTPLAAFARHLYGGQIKGLLMLVSLYLILYVPVPTRLFGDKEAFEQKRSFPLDA